MRPALAAPAPPVSAVEDAAPATGPESTSRSGLGGARCIGDLSALFKVRIALLAAFAAAAGFYLGARGPLDSLALAHTFLGVLLLSAASSALNQVLERDADARMSRTRDRPLPAGRMGVTEALAAGAAAAAAGLVELGWFAGGLSALLAAAALGSYVLVYTPLKRRTHLATLVGGVPGALPPVIGWAAARGELGLEALALFAILFLWQLPHVLAITELHREDYRRGGFPVLAVLEGGRPAAARAIVLNCLALLPVGLFPSFLGMTGRWAGVTALVLGLFLLAFGVRAALVSSRKASRGLLLASLVYLPLLLLVFVLDKG